MFYSSSDIAFIGAFYVLSSIETDDGFDEERVSKYFSHKEMAQAFIAECDVQQNEVLYIEKVDAYNVCIHD